MTLSHGMSLPRQRPNQGAALVETALVLIYLLGLLFIGFQVGLISYYQLAMDQGSQMQARATALGTSTTSANELLTSNLPKLSFANLGNPVTNNPTKFQTNGVNFNFNNPGARTGGYTINAPLPHVSTLSQNSGLLRIGVIPITISSVAVEATVKELCPHYCLIAGGVNASTANDTLAYFQKGDNTAPYFIGYNLTKNCMANPDYDLGAISPVLQPPTWIWNNCPIAAPGGIEWRALGTAAHLDETNSSYTLPGETLDRSYSRLPAQAPSRTQAGPFFELWCHRNIYAWIQLNAFPNATPPLPTTSAQATAFLKTIFGTSPTTGLPLPGSIIYNSNTAEGVTAGWDSMNIAGKPNAKTSTTSQLRPWWGCGVLNGGN